MWLKLAAAIGTALILLTAKYAGATWKPDYANSPPEWIAWFNSAQLTDQARTRFAFKNCCAKRLLTPRSGHSTSGLPPTLTNSPTGRAQRSTHGPPRRLERQSRVATGTTLCTPGLANGRQLRRPTCIRLSRADASPAHGI